MPELRKVKIGVCLDHDYYLIDGKMFQCDYVDNTFKSYEEMLAAIDRKDLVRKTQNRKKLCLSVIDNTGTRRELAGVHAGHGKMILKPPFDRYEREDLYPYIDWIEQAVAEKKKLNEQVEILGDILFEFRLEEKSGYGFDPSQHSAEVDRLQAEFDEKLKAAQKTSLKAMREKIAEPRKRRIRL